jgi:hypothetical protein
MAVTALNEPRMLRRWILETIVEEKLVRVVGLDFALSKS